MAEKTKVALSAWFAIRISVVWLWPASSRERGWSLTSFFVHSQLLFHRLKLLRSYVIYNVRSLHLQRESSFLNKYMFAVVDKHLWKFQDNKNRKKPGKPRTTVISAGYNLKRWKLRLNLQNRLTVWVKGVELLVLCVISIKCITFCLCLS